MHCVHFSGIDHFFVSSLPVLPFSPVHKSVSETSHLVESSPANSAFNCWEKGMGGGAFVSLGKGQVALAIWVSFIPDICLWFRSHFPQFLPEHLSLSSVPHHPHSCSFSACPLSLFLPHPLYFQNQSCVCLVKILSAFLLAIYKVLFTLLHKNSDFYPSRYPRVFPIPSLSSLYCNHPKIHSLQLQKKQIPQPLWFRQMHWEVHRCRCTENSKIRTMKPSHKLSANHAHVLRVFASC